ncbi:MAG: MerR family transcriptional regulator [Actinomycetota bacterium]|nr:MerR family transcriptional regulator [Actinomycetota bacterium]MDI6821757.1 MerR family transcriptional regulator [Actinomycetota bacterium]
MILIPEEDKPVFPIGIVAEMLKVHPETLRIWERNGIIHPARQGYRRLYSSLDLKRLGFVHNLIEKDGLNLAGVKRFIQMYPCWQRKYCSGGRPKGSGQRINPSKPCWKELGTYCLKPVDKAEFCSGCRFRRRERC